MARWYRRWKNYRARRRYYRNLYWNQIKYMRPEQKKFANRLRSNYFTAKIDFMLRLRMMEDFHYYFTNITDNETLLTQGTNSLHIARFINRSDQYKNITAVYEQVKVYAYRIQFTPGQANLLYQGGLPYNFLVGYNYYDRIRDNSQAVQYIPFNTFFSKFHRCMAYKQYMPASQDEDDRNNNEGVPGVFTLRDTVGDMGGGNPAPAVAPWWMVKITCYFKMKKNSLYQ